MLPQSNAVLTKVAGSGTAADYDTPAGADMTRWEGSAPAYYREIRERISTSEGSDVIVRRELIVHTRVPALGYVQGDTLTFNVEGEQRSGEVQEIVRSQLRAAGAVETTRLVLEPA